MEPKEIVFVFPTTHLRPASQKLTLSVDPPAENQSADIFRLEEPDPFRLFRSALLSNHPLWDPRLSQFPVNKKQTPADAVIKGFRLGVMPDDNDPIPLELRPHACDAALGCFITAKVFEFNF